jgi:hypothetical protein
LFFVEAIFLRVAFDAPLSFKRASRSALLLLTGGLALGLVLLRAPLGLVLLRVPCWCCGAAEEEPGIVWAKMQEKMVIEQRNWKGYCGHHAFLHPHSCGCDARVICSSM